MMPPCADWPSTIAQVSSTEAPMRSNGEFGYDVGAARAYANHREAPPVSPHYGSEMGSGEMMGPYRGGGVYQYGNKPYYPNVPACYNGYGEEGVDYSLNCTSYPVLNHDPNHMVPYHWTSRPKQTPPAGVYADPEPAYSYGNTSNLVHRPAVSNESPGFIPSYSSPLPASNNDRQLPTPVSRSLPSSTGPASGPYRSDGPPPPYKAASTAVPVTTPPATSMPDVTVAGYANSTVHTAPADDPPLAGYPPAVTTLPSQSRPTYAPVEVYSPAEAIFSEQERGIGTQGSSVEIAGYTYGSTSSSAVRRPSSSSGPTTATPSGTLPNGQSYVPSESSHMSGHHHAAAVAGVTTTPAGFAGETATAGSGVTTHSDAHRGSVSSRR